MPDKREESFFIREVLLRSKRQFRAVAEYIFLRRTIIITIQHNKIKRMLFWDVYCNCADVNKIMAIIHFVLFYSSCAYGFIRIQANSVFNYTIGIQKK